MGDVLTIDEVNALDERAFVDRFAHVYEDTPTLAAAAWSARPFTDRTGLREAFADAARALDVDAVLALVRAHPALAVGGTMADASRREQRGAGLTATDDPAVAEIRAGNVAYEERFGFPFVIAVRGLGTRAIADALAARLANSPADEVPIALEQIIRIAAYRIEELVAP